MAFPNPLTYTQGVQSSSSSAWTLTAPAGLCQNDLLLLFASIDGTATISSFTGTFGTGAEGPASTANNNVAVSVALSKVKIGSGSLSSTFTLNLSAVREGCWALVRIDSWERTLGTQYVDNANGGAVPYFGATTGTSTSPTPVGSANPSQWDIEDTLWLHAACADGGDTVFSAQSAEYTLLGSFLNSGGSSGTALAVEYRMARVSSETGGALTISPSEEWVVGGVAVRPLAVLGSPPSVATARVSVAGVG